ncbi:hypothetical protein N4R57_05805 [Rhodobacteraceae bacterium D3-12]|nr:hypothetical protein N4R57_05805 [Rhodobacteraceae bacterium D3-12]
MKPRLPHIGAQKGLRYILLAQLALAGLLMTNRACDMLPAMSRNTQTLPSGPISPGISGASIAPTVPNPAC